MKLAKKPKIKPQIKSKNKSYNLLDSPFYNLTTKKRLSELFDKPIKELRNLSTDSNYRKFFIEQKNKKREIQAPVFKLDLVQTRVASLLVRIAMPDYMHSGIKKRSNVTNAQVHTGNFPVLTMDIQKFYPSISKKSIFNFFHNTMKASSDVADILAKLCSFEDHIPTGSRISMPLSFWANHAMYSRIHSLCLRKNISMSVFVDDLTFSGNNVDSHFKSNIKKIIQSAGLTVHPKKTRLYYRDDPKLITGVIVNRTGVAVKNKHHNDIYTLFSEIPQCMDDEQLKIKQKQLVGSLSAAGQIDPKFKIRATQLRKKTFKVIFN